MDIIQKGDTMLLVPCSFVYILIWGLSVVLYLYIAYRIVDECGMMW